MELTRISIPISVPEREGLRALAKQEGIDPREYVRYLLRKTLQRRGILQKASRVNQTFIDR